MLGGGEADALRRRGEAGEAGAGREWVFTADEGFEALEREGEVRAALVAGDGVDLVHDEGANAAQGLTRFRGGEQDVEAFGRGDEDVRRMAQHGRAILLERVAGTHAGADLWAEIAALEGELLDFGERADEVLLDVV